MACTASTRPLDVFSTEVSMVALHVTRSVAVRLCSRLSVHRAHVRQHAVAAQVFKETVGGSVGASAESFFFKTFIF